MCVSRSHVVIWFYFLLQGIQIAVTLPTLNLYLLSYGAEPDFIGLSLAAGTFSGLVTAPIYGRVSDKLRSLKPVLIVGISFQIIGCLIYFTAKSPIVILVGMATLGIGPGAESSVLGTVARCSDDQNRAAAFSKVFGTFQLGFLIGCACNFLFAKLHFDLGPFTVDAYTAPGLFMALLWAVYQVFFICCYVEIARDEQDETIRQRPSLTWRIVARDLFREDVVICLWSSFVIIFMQSGYEAWFAPFTKTYFGWNGVQNALLLAGVSIKTLLGFVVVTQLSKKKSNASILLIGTCALCAVQPVFLMLMIFLEKQSSISYSIIVKWPVLVFCLGTLVFALFMAFVTATQVSIYSKAVNKNHMDFFQGFRLLIYGIGQILGPLWATGLLSHLPVVVVGNWLLATLSLISIAVSYKRLKGSNIRAIAVDDAAPDSNREAPNEKTSLLSRNV